MVLIFASLSLSRDRFPSNYPAKDKMFSNGTHEFKPTTLLISLDGFRADFLYRDLSPTLSAFANSGLSPRFLIPSFPTATFPNHWTFVTGLYPESHGIVGNQFWDPKLNEEFHNVDPEHSLQRKWWGGEPLWVTAERQGVKTAVHMWPGSEAAGGWGISYLDKFNGKEPLPRKTARIMEWLDLPIGDRPQLIAAYVPNVDSIGHQFGPNTTESDAVIREVDAMMADILHGLVQRNLSEIINIVVVSDHGMASTDNERLIYIDDIIDMSLIEHNDGWPLIGLRPYPHANITELYEKLKAEVSLNEKKGDKHWNVYLRDEDMPPRWHFSNNQRIAPLWVIPDAGYAIVTRKEFDLGAPNPGKYKPAGLHGYDNDDPLMRAIFVARGPSFRHLHGAGRGWMFDAHSEEDDVRKGLVEEFGNWEVHRIICETLGIHEAIGGTNATIKNLGSFKLIDEEKDGKPDLKPTQSSLPTTSTVTEEGLIIISQTYTQSSRETSRPAPTQPPSRPADGDGEGDRGGDSEGDRGGNRGGDREGDRGGDRGGDREGDRGGDREGDREGDEELDGTEGKDPSDMTPWEYLKWKAEKLKDQLDEWWEGVWSGDN